MDQDLIKDSVLHGLISVVIAVVITYGVSMVIPTQGLVWALYAVAFAAFFSSASTVYVKSQE